MVEQISANASANTAVAAGAAPSPARASADAAAANGADARSGQRLDSETQRAGAELKRAVLDELVGTDVDQPHELRLRVERDIDMLVGEVVNRDTNEVVREIPPEEIVATAKKLNAILGQVLDRMV